MTQGRSGNWTRRLYEVPDARLVQAEREVYNQYGVDVSIDAKSKSLLRFGRNSDLSLAQETVWTLGSHEAYVNDNLITHISSSSTLDNQLIRLESHTVDGDGDFTFVVQTVQLDGQNKVSLPTPVARVSMAINSNSHNLVGSVYVYEDTAISAGVPVDLTKAHIQIPAGSNQSFKAATTFDKETYAFITQGFGGVGNKQTANIEFELQVRPKGGVFQTGAAIIAGSSSGNFNVNLDPVAIVPANSDVRITCTSDNAGAEAFVNFNLYMAKVLL
jgi:hypothetical protein